MKLKRFIPILIIFFYASSAFATPPNLTSGVTTCADNYCILLSGTDFQSDAYVDVRPINSGIIASYRGSSLIRTNSNTTDTLQLTITDQTQKDLLNTTGLRFYVVNPGNGWDGPISIIRQAPIQAPPNLVSGVTTCADNYCILLSGTDFQSDAYVDVRPINSGIIASYRGSSLIRTNSNTTDTLQLTITDQTQKDLLNTTGLRFYVVNPGNGWDGPISIIRQAPIQPPPNLVSGVTTCADNYCILLSGTDFQSDAYVDVKSANSSTIIASYSGSSLIRTNSNTTDTLQLTITNQTQKDLLNTTGLRFYVVNPGNGSDGPISIIRQAPIQPPPNLVSGVTTCADNYCILLSGTDFQFDAYVDVRPINSGIIASYRGSSLIRTNSNTTDTLQLTITDQTQKDLLNTTGLRFYVVNPGNGWDGPVLIKRDAPPIGIGGSILSWYDHQWTNNDNPSDQESIVMDYGIIKNYHHTGVRDMVKDQLNVMFLEGQRKIGVSFWHGRGQQLLTHGTFINTRAKEGKKGVYYIEPQYIVNLSNYLNDIKAQGFNEVLLNVMPSGCNNTTTWVSWYLSCKKDIDYTFLYGTDTLITSPYDPNDPEPLWQQTPIWKENWKVLEKLTNTIKVVGINYKIDLNNEAIPADNFETGFAISGCINETNNPDQCLKNYPIELNLFLDRTIALLKFRWENYTNVFDKTNTVGYSIIAQNLWGAQHRSATMSAIYGKNYPDYLDLHIYSNSKEEVEASFNYFKALFPSKPIIIGEAYYNDVDSAQDIRDAILASGINFKYLLQWPLARIDGIGIEGYKHLPPLRFDNYMNEGF